MPKIHYDSHSAQLPAHQLPAQLIDHMGEVEHVGGPPHIALIAERAHEKFEQVCNISLHHVESRYIKDYDVNAEVAREHIVELKRFLAICAASSTESEIVGMAGPVDDAWHTFLLFTREYLSFCRALGVDFIHHAPDVDEESSKVSTDGYSLFLNVYENAFDDFAPAHIWPQGSPLYAGGGGSGDGGGGGSAGATTACTGCGTGGPGGCSHCSACAGQGCSNRGHGGGGGGGGGYNTCVPGDTPVLMADGTWKPIAEIKIGEQIQGKSSVNTVLAYDRITLGQHRNPVLYSVNGDFYNTDDHLMVTKHGWTVIDQAGYLAYHGMKLGCVYDENNQSTPMTFVGIDPADVSELKLGSLIAFGGDQFKLIDRLEADRSFAADTRLYSLVADGDHTMQVAGGYVLSAWANQEDYDYSSWFESEGPSHELVIAEDEGESVITSA